MNSWLVGFVVAAVAVLQASCDPTGVSDRCKVIYVPNGGNNRPGLDFVGLQRSVSYYCHDDYYMEGHETITCHPHGWDHKPPVCKPNKPIKQCRYQLKELEYGLIDAEIKEYYNPGERIWYFCFEPYYLEGAQDVSCLSTGLWNYPPPRCISKVKQCKRRNPPANGSQQPDKPVYDAGDAVYYECNHPYQLRDDDSNVAFCTPTGEWSHPVPKCEAPTCPALQAPENGYLTPEQDEYSRGEMVIFKCFEHYKLVGFRKLTCRPDGTWNYPVPRCDPITCDPVNPPVYGSLSPVKDIYLVKERITYECDEFFTLIGDKIAVCQDNGEFSGEVPECRPQQCERPVIDDGSFSPNKPVYDVGDYVKFRCDEKFELTGEKTVHCLPGGVWSSPFPTCHPIQCDRPVFDNGSLDEDKDIYHVGDIVTFICDMGFVLDGADKLKCQRNGEFSGPIPTCEPVFCDRPVFENGELDEDKDAYSVGELVTFICDEGFTRVGAKKLTCLKTGQFSGPIPTCAPNMCDRPFIDNGSFTNDDKDMFAVDEMVVFSCDMGFVLQGIEKITCQADSLWSDPFPVCIPVLCEGFNVVNGILTPDQLYYSVNDMVKITCEKGFMLQGAPKLTCLKSGKFDFPAPICKPVSCDRPIFNGILDEDKDSYAPHETVVFICEKGYVLKGERSLKCGFDGKWSDEFPTCVRVKCEKPIIRYGLVKPSKDLYHVDDIVIFKCEDGFILKGARSAQCESDGGWSEKFPVCKRITCSPRPEIDNGRFEDVQDVYVPGDMVKFFCNRNFYLDGEMKITCLGNGQWSDPFPTCREFTCPDPFLVNGIVRPDQDEYTFGDNVVFVCNRGFTLVGEKKLTCGKMGQWSDDFPICEENQCPQPTRPDDGSFSPVQNGYDIGDKVTFDCDMGFNLVGEEVIVCLKSGDWSDEFPTCEAVTCPRPVVEDGVSFRPSRNEYDVGQRVNFKCERGSTLVGAEYVECLKTGDWSDEFPTCEPNKCVKPSIDDGSFTPYKNLYHVGDEVSFRCDEGLVLNGEDEIRCLTDGEWSDDFPTCERVQCLPNPEIEDGVFDPVQNIYYYLDVVNFECNNGFTLVGKASIKCLVTGRWSHSFPVCEPNQCDPPQRNPNIFSVTPSQNAYDIGDEVTFRCQRGFKLVGSKTSECQYDLTWSPVEPTCMKIIVCKNPPRPKYSTQSPSQRFYDVGDKITYTCADDFELKGDSVIMCQDDGNFYPRPPICKRPPAKCRRPYTHRKLSVSPDQRYYNPGDVIEFECDKPYQLDGESQLTCKTNGRWNTYTPSCVFGVSDSCKHRGCKELWGGPGQPCQCNKYCRYFSKETRPKYACCDDYEATCSH